MDDRTGETVNKRAVNVIIGKLEALHDKSPMEVETGMRAVELLLVDLRDDLIDAVRRAGDPRSREALEQVNTTLSLVLALEYPVSGLERGKIKEASALLRTMAAPPAA